jgi:hypothetical protein
MLIREISGFLSQRGFHSVFMWGIDKESLLPFLGLGTFGSG